MTAAMSSIFLLALIQWRRGVSREAKRLYGGLAAYILVYGILATVVSRLQVAHETPTGTWYDLGWSVPLLFGAFWAASWQPGTESESHLRKRNHTLSEVLVNNAILFFAPILTLLPAPHLCPAP